MATKYAVASGVWSAVAVWSDSDGGAGGATVPADGDTVIISAGVSVKMDVDQSAWTGLAGNNIIRGGSTPGMLYFCNGDDGHLKLRTAATLQGTTDTNRGRLLANSDGDWSTTTPLQFSNKAVIDLQGTAEIQATNLDIKCHATHPTNGYVRTYGTKYDFNGETAVTPATDVIDLGATPPSAGTAVCVTTAAGTLPTGLAEDTVYYVRSVSGNTCKLALQNSDATIVDITAVGSGTCSLITGYASGSATVNVLEDVTADTPWVTTTGHNRVVLCNSLSPGSYDQQRLTLTTIGATTIVLSATVDSTQTPGARIYLSSRNVSIRSAGTSSTQAIVLYGSSDTHGGVFGCEIINTAGTGTTFYGYGVSGGTGCTISGTVSGCSRGFSSGSGFTISGTVSGCNTGFGSGSGHTISGTVSGCSNGFSSGSGHTISGTVSGCTNGVYLGFGHTISGTVSGCSNGVREGGGYTISGTVSGCGTGFSGGSGYTISGTVSGCNFGVHTGAGYTISGTVSGNTSDFRGYITAIVTNGGDIGADPTWFDRNTAYQHQRVSCENFNGVLNAHKIFDAFGDIVRTACDGTGDAPSADPDGGNGYCFEASNIQSNCGHGSPLLIFDKLWLWMTAATHTITFKVQTTYAGISAGNLKLTAEYLGTDNARAVATNAPAISTRSGAADWSQTLAVTITPNSAGWVSLKMELMEYQAGDEVYVWPAPAVT
jgi:hypothetical protein